MTSARIVRGTKIRIFVCFCAIVVILGLLVCYNNTISQLNETQKSLELCHRQEENLSVQLQVISDYKLRLEKALKSEKAEHNKSNITYDKVINEEKLQNTKNTNEANLRFNSLQQRYNLLKTEHEDYKEKITKTHQIDIKELQEKLNHAEEELKDIKDSKEKLKNEYLSLQIENDDLKRQLEGNEGNENKTNYLQKQNIQLRREITNLKDRYAVHGNTIQEHLVLNEIVNNGNQENILNPDEQQKEQNVLVLPVPHNESNVKSSSTSSSVKYGSEGSLNGARPLALPTMTPKNKGHPNLNQNKDPEDFARRKSPDNENPNDIIDNRYRNKIDQEGKENKHEENENENVANEVFEQPNLPDDGLGFGEAIKQAEKPKVNGKHIDNLGVYKESAPRNEGEGEYKEGGGPNDQLEENVGMDEGEDDDQDEYGDHLVKNRDPAVRN